MSIQQPPNRGSGNTSDEILPPPAGFGRSPVAAPRSNTSLGIGPSGKPRLPTPPSSPELSRSSSVYGKIIKTHLNQGGVRYSEVVHEGGDVLIPVSIQSSVPYTQVVPGGVAGQDLSSQARSNSAKVDWVPPFAKRSEDENSVGLSREEIFAVPSRRRQSRESRDYQSHGPLGQRRNLESSRESALLAKQIERLRLQEQEQQRRAAEENANARENLRSEMVAGGEIPPSYQESQQQHQEALAQQQLQMRQQQEDMRRLLSQQNRIEQARAKNSAQPALVQAQPGPFVYGPQAQNLVQTQERGTSYGVDQTGGLARSASQIVRSSNHSGFSR